jgi:hypothetical protein
MKAPSRETVEGAFNDFRDQFGEAVAIATLEQIFGTRDLRNVPDNQLMLAYAALLGDFAMLCSARGKKKPAPANVNRYANLHAALDRIRATAFAKLGAR